MTSRSFPRHEQSDIEQVVSSRGRFEIVEKMQAAVRATVIRLDPRSQPPSASAP